MAAYRVVLPLARHGIIVPVGSVVEIEPEVAADPAVAYRIARILDPPKTPDPTPDLIVALAPVSRKAERAAKVAAVDMPAETKAEQE